MAGPGSKSTKKFEKKHLKSILDKRKDIAKIKQRSQQKEKKRARKAKENARAEDLAEDETSPESTRQKSVKDQKLENMTMDDFFAGGFETVLDEQPKHPKHSRPSQTPLRKRKREADEENDSGGGVLSGSDLEGNLHQAEDSEDSGFDMADEPMDHANDLNTLKESDPEFYKYLQENDADLLRFDNPEMDNISEEDDDEQRDVLPIHRADDPENEGAPVADKVLTIPMVTKFSSLMQQKYSLRAMREIVLAFRTAAHGSEDTTKRFRYSIPNSDIYNAVLKSALYNIPAVLQHHMPVQKGTNGKERVQSNSKVYQNTMPLLNSHIISLTTLLSELTDMKTLQTVLECTLPLLPYILSFKKSLKNLLKHVVEIWSNPSSADVVIYKAFLIISKACFNGDTSLREATLKLVYQGLIRGCRQTTPRTLPAINIMKNLAAGLWGEDEFLGYTVGFKYIRQLAIHLRTSITQPTKESYKLIYNWQYVHSLDFWTRVLSLSCDPRENRMLKKSSDSPLHPLIYPVVQITLGALRLIPTPAYFPLRFHLTRSLLRISRSTNTFIPLASSLLEVLHSPELTKPPKASTLKALDFNITLHAPKQYLHTRIYQDALGEQVIDLLAEFFGIWCKSIAFPELVIPPTIMMKRWLKAASAAPSRSRKLENGHTVGGRGNKNSKVNAMVAQLCQKISMNTSFIETRRRKVEFSVDNRAEVDKFLSEVSWEDMPLAAYVVGIRKQREERDRMLEKTRADAKDQSKGLPKPNAPSGLDGAFEDASEDTSGEEHDLVVDDEDEAL